MNLNGENEEGNNLPQKSRYYLVRAIQRGATVVNILMKHSFLNFGECQGFINRTITIFSCYTDCMKNIFKV